VSGRDSDEVGWCLLDSENGIIWLIASMMEEGNDIGESEGEGSCVGAVTMSANESNSHFHFTMEATPERGQGL
jgi:hypothetical protein